MYNEEVKMSYDDINYHQLFTPNMFDELEQRIANKKIIEELNKLICIIKNSHELLFFVLLKTDDNSRLNALYCLLTTCLMNTEKCTKQIIDELKK